MDEHIKHQDPNKKDNDKQAMNDHTEDNVSIQASLNCQKELQDLKDKYIRVNADLQNFQARIAKERASWMYEAQAELILGLLSIVDNFERAFTEHQKQVHDEKFAAWLEGFELIGKELAKFLYDKGIREIDCSTTFDPHYHEAIAQIAVPDKQSNDIVDVAQKGYLFNDMVSRPAKVVVAK